MHMKRSKYHFAAIQIVSFTLLLALVGHLAPCPAWGVGSAGLSLNLYLTQSGSNQFPLGSPIELILVIKNKTEWPIITLRGFSQKEFYKSLLVYDQNDKKKVYRPITVAETDEDLHTMPSAVFIREKPMVPSETIPEGWVKSITIADIREHFPVLKTTPGSYAIKAEQPYMRFQWGLELRSLGMLGDAVHPDNFPGPLESNTIPFSIFPADGAAVSVRVQNVSSDPAEPIVQVPVRVFQSSDIPPGYSNDDIFTKLKPVLVGKTNFEGNTTWDTGSRCLLNGNYTILTKYANDYGEASISKDSEPGWEIGCSGLISKTISFGEAPSPEPSAPGDLEGDGDVDRNDLNIVLSFRNKPASECPACDIDGDGMITVLDLRKLVLLCTRPRCAVE